LLDRRRFVGFTSDGEGASDLSGSSTVDNSRVADEGADNAEGVMESTLGLIDDL
jgi:hypothetical protein